MTKKIFKLIHLLQEGIGILIDNKLTIPLEKNCIFHEGAKTDISYHFIREHINEKEMELEYVKIQD